MSIQDNVQILTEEIEKLSKEKITNSTAQLLSTYYEARKCLVEMQAPLTKETENDIIISHSEYLPSARDYFNTHERRILEKLCLEIQELCVSVYSTLRNEEEKNIYSMMSRNIQK